tara:strand:+ start:2113 stop:2625 length:513 start_codon:yes stop_codon:yes gene_type:complete
MDTLESAQNKELILLSVLKGGGNYWEKIEGFLAQFNNIDSTLAHHTSEMNEHFPTTHRIENGMYTRQVFMPKGSLVASFIHKQNHPSFFLSGEMSILNEKGIIESLKAPLSLNTLIGTQRIAYMHTDCVWVCVYRTDKESIQEAEKEVYTLDYRTLPKEILLNKNEICQE